MSILQCAWFASDFEVNTHTKYGRIRRFLRIKLREIVAVLTFVYRLIHFATRPSQRRNNAHHHTLWRNNARVPAIHLIAIASRIDPTSAPSSRNLTFDICSLYEFFLFNPSSDETLSLPNIAPNMAPDLTPETPLRRGVLHAVKPAADSADQGKFLPRLVNPKSQKRGLLGPFSAYPMRFCQFRRRARSTAKAPTGRLPDERSARGKANRRRSSGPLPRKRRWRPGRRHVHRRYRA